MKWADLEAQWQALGLGAHEIRVYEALLSTPSDATRAALAQRLALSPRQLRNAFERLDDRGFTRPGRGTGLPVPEAPATALRNLVHLRQAELHRREAELQELTGSVDRMAAQLMSASPAPRTIGIETLRGRAEIAERVTSLVVSATEEVALLDRPPYAASEPDGMPAPINMAEPVRRGVRVRAVVDREGLRFQGRARGLNVLAAEGVQIRLGTDLPTKLIMVDRRMTLLPPTDAADPTATALVVSDALLSNALVPLFEAVWDRAVPIGSAENGQVTDEDRELLTMLSSGLKDEAIARRLEIHVHTVRRRISRLMHELKAETRFQAGVQAALRGWLTL